MLLLVVLVLLVALDQVSKYILYDLAWGAEFFLLTPVLNYGVAWSLPVPGWLVFVVSGLVIAGLAVLFFRFCFVSGTLFAETDVEQSWIGQLFRMRFVLVMFLAGAVGNLVDRIVYGGVRDFLDLGFFPVFNLADVFLTVSIVLVLWYEFVHKKDCNAIEKD